MQLVHLLTGGENRWAFEGHLLPQNFTLNLLLELPRSAQLDFLRQITTTQEASGGLDVPIEDSHEVWAAGLTYLRTNQARQSESDAGDVYERAYQAERPYLFFKSSGWRVVGPEASVHVRHDSARNVPEPELVLVINKQGEICGYTAGNDVSARDIEEENPLYLPQSKTFNGACALGPHIVLVHSEEELNNLTIRMTIWRDGKIIFQEQTSTVLMNRKFAALTDYLFRELHFPHGVFLMSGTGIKPPDAFSMQHGDEILIAVGNLTLHNRVVG